MKPSIYRVELDAPGALYVMPKPSGEWLDDDICELQRMGINKIVSLLSDDEVDELGLSREGIICSEQRIEFARYAIRDRGLPDPTEFSQLVATAKGDIDNEMHIAVHCRAGIGRAGMLASCVLQMFGSQADDAIAKVSAARGVPIPDTEQQREFIRSFGL